MWLLVGVIIGSVAVHIFYQTRVILLEEFTGVVDYINGNTAFVTLTEENGDKELEGEYPADELAEYGIVLNSHFRCQTILKGDKPQIVFEYLPIVSLKKSLQYASSSRIKI